MSAIVAGPGLNAVMLVEDDLGLREELRESLRDAGFHVIAVGDAPGALKILQTYDGLIEWLVTDINLGEMSGLHVAFEFRFLHPLRPIVFISGFEPSPEIDRIERAVMLRKPFSSKDLIDIMIDLRDRTAEEPTGA